MNTHKYITFAVNAVKRAETPYPVQSYAEAITATLGGGALEAYSRDTRTLVATQHFEENISHAFIRAVNLAYDKHYPLTLSPDMIWLLIAQGFALHININAEALRERFVQHAGKLPLSVRRDTFVKGFDGNDWEGVFAEFSSQIQAQVSETTHALVTKTFSTTGLVERAALDVTLMDTVQRYSNYELLTACGIPEITLEGSPEDWLALREAARFLQAYDLDWWIPHLLSVLDQFVAASQGTADPAFWKNFYKYSGQSGGPYITGHVVNFFPYIAFASPAQFSGNYDEAQHRPHRNGYLGWIPSTIPEDDLVARRLSREGFQGLISDVLPSSLSRAPFTWECNGVSYPMEFYAGFIGVAQDAETLALRPEIGWAVCDSAGPIHPVAET